MLSCAVRLLESDYSKDTEDKLRNYLPAFVKKAEKIYKSAFMSYNVHSLLHVVEDFKKFGNISFVSALPFESYLYQLKRRVRKGDQVIAQLMTRIKEGEYDSFVKEKWSSSFSSIRDKYYLIEEHLFEVEEWTENFVVGHFWKDRDEFLRYPEPWSTFGVYVFRRQSKHRKQISRTQLKNQVLCLPTENGKSLVLFPIMKNSPF